ncbi:MAG TPA: phosphoribosylanthranilate isomerase [Acidimicrobiales bacterium]|nr:phosphoribosylanthranilate isomerase [Acidimicrobiales bacterium]
MFVKICGVTNEEDALLAVAMGADAVGFVFAPSTRQIAPQKAADIAKRLPSEIVTVGVFRDETRQRVVDIVHQSGLRAAQLHGHEPPATSRWVRARVPLLFKAFAAGDTLLEQADDYGADAILVDSLRPGSGEVFDWSLAEGAPTDRKVILAGGLTPENVGDAVRHIRPWGVDVSSGVEALPGRKDARKLRSFIYAARIAEPPAPAEQTPASAAGPDRTGDRRPGDRPFDWMADDPS